MDIQINAALGQYERVQAHGQEGAGPYEAHGHQEVVATRRSSS